LDVKIGDVSDPKNTLPHPSFRASEKGQSTQCREATGGEKIASSETHGGHSNAGRRERGGV